MEDLKDFVKADPSARGAVDDRCSYVRLRGRLSDLVRAIFGLARDRWVRTSRRDAALKAADDLALLEPLSVRRSM